MTTQPNTCPDCGKPLVDIHTCSPQVANTNDADREVFKSWWHEIENYSMRCERFVTTFTEAEAIWQAALLHARKIDETSFKKDMVAAGIDITQAPWIGVIGGLRAAYTARENAPEWMDISSAPKDGGHVLLYAPELQFVGFYAEASGWCYVAPRCPLAPTQPTHWKPLPLPPTKE